MKRFLIFLFICASGYAQAIMPVPGVFSLSTSSGGGGGSGTVTSVSFTGGLISVANPTTTPAFTVAGTSGGIPYFSSSSTWDSSGALTANAFIKGGGAGAAPTSSLFSDNGTTATYSGTGGIAVTGSATGKFTATGVTSGSAIFTGVDAMGQNITVSVAAQTTGAATATIVDMAGSNQTIAFSELRQNSQSTAYQFVLSDAYSKHILHPSSDNNARTFTIPANASVAFPVGATITVVNSINTLTIAITSDTLTWYAGSGTASTGSRTIAAGSVITLLKISSTSWIITGNGIS